MRVTGAVGVGVMLALYGVALVVATREPAASQAVDARPAAEPMPRAA